jgi:hypothetical protein
MTSSDRRLTTSFPRRSSPSWPSASPATSSCISVSRRRDLPIEVGVGGGDDANVDAPLIRLIIPTSISKVRSIRWHC